MSEDNATATPPPLVPSVPAGHRVYAIGDIHGRLDLLERLHDLIAADARIGEPRRVSLVYLGDYIDRGPASKGVIDALVARAAQPLGDAAPPEGAAAVFLKGNHEDLLLRFLAGRLGLWDWWMNGGGTTLASYGIMAPKLADPEREARERLAAALPPDHAAFLANLALRHRIGDYLFVHAGIRPGVALDAQAEADLMWIREPFLASTADHGVVVVHGHTIAAAPEIRANRIGIDTGAFTSGRLTCLVLEGETQRLLGA